MAIRARGNGLEVDVQVTVAGEKRRYRETIHATLLQARAFEAVVQNALMQGREPLPFKQAPDAGHTLALGKALEDVHARYWAGGGMERTVRSNMASCVEFFGEGRDLSSITSADMDDFIQWLKAQDLAPSTIRQKVSVMSRAFHHFHRRGNLKGVPVYELPRIGDNTRDRVVTEEEFQTLCAAHADQPLVAALWTVLMDTGARPSELREVCSPDLRDDLLTLRETKNGKSRTIPLTPRALAAMKLAIERTDGIPFGWASKDAIRHRWAYARERMGLSHDEGFIPYALRHTCATRLYAKTRDLMLVQRWMGHEDIKMTLRYAKLQPGDLERARDLLLT